MFKQIVFVEAETNEEGELTRVIAHQADCHEADDPVAQGCYEEAPCPCDGNYQNAYEATSHFNRNLDPGWDKWVTVEFATCTDWETPALVKYRSRECQFCHLVSTFNIPIEAEAALKNAAPIHEVFPTMETTEREHISQGIHPSCWEENLGMFIGGMTNHK